MYEAFEIQKHKGNEELLNKALKGPLHEQKIASYFVKTAQPEDKDLILMSGIGNSWPILRSHTLLNSLHPLLQDTHLWLFFILENMTARACVFLAN